MIGQIDHKHEAKCVQGGFFYILKVCKLLRVSEAEELVRDSFYFLIACALLLAFA